VSVGAQLAIACAAQARVFAERSRGAGGWRRAALRREVCFVPARRGACSPHALGFAEASRGAAERRGGASAPA